MSTKWKPLGWTPITNSGNCGTGAGGFQPGNTCAIGGGGASLEDQPKKRQTFEEMMAEGEKFRLQLIAEREERKNQRAKAGPKEGDGGYKLKKRSGEFGILAGPKAYLVPTDDDRLNEIVEEGSEVLGDDTENQRFLKDKGLSQLPPGWSFDNTFEVIALMSGEFSPLMPDREKFTAKQLGRSLMQLVESYSEPEAYIGKEAELPQDLTSFERIGQWLMDNKLVGLQAKEEFKEGYFTGHGVKSAKASLKHIKQMRG